MSEYKMISFKVKRPIKQNKSESVSFRLTPSELEELEQLKANLKFDNTRDFILFCMDVLKSLDEWNSLNYRFFIGNPEKKDYKEVEFEFNPLFESETSKKGG